MQCSNTQSVIIIITDCSVFANLDTPDYVGCEDYYLSKVVGFSYGENLVCPGQVTWFAKDRNGLMQIAQFTDPKAYKRIDITKDGIPVQYYFECICETQTYTGRLIPTFSEGAPCNAPPSHVGGSQVGGGREEAFECLPKLFSDVMASYYEELICATKAQWQGGGQQAIAYLERLKQATLQNPVLASYSPNLSLINQQTVLTALQGINCKAAAQEFAKAFANNITVDEYYGKIRPTYNDVANYLKNQNTPYYLTPAGKAFELPSGATPIFFKSGTFPKGTLHGFKLANGLTYIADINTGAAVQTMNGYLQNKAKEKIYYPLPKLPVQGRQPAYILIRYDENGVCGYRKYLGEYEFAGPNANPTNQIIPGENTPLTPPLQDVVLENCADSEKITILEFEGNIFTIHEKEGKVTQVESEWNSFGKCASCGAKADLVLQGVLGKAQAQAGGIASLETVVVPAITMDYGPAGNIIYKAINLKDLLRNLSKTYNSFVDKAKVPDAVWKPQSDLLPEDKDFFVQDKTGVISGALDQAIEDIKDLPALVGLGLSVVSDPQGAKNQLITFAQTMNWDKARDLAEGIAKEAIQYENFSKGSQYALYATGRVGVTLAKVVASGGLIAVVKDAPNQLKKKLDDVLAIISQLRTEVQVVVTQFSDKTLLKFGNDLTDVDFFDWVNNPENFLAVKGFLAHKNGVITDLERQQLAEMLDKDEITHPKAKEWLERSENVATFKGYTDAGRLFETNMKVALSNISSSVYQGLLNKVADLDQRTILSQVQFCIKGNCIGKGEYFIADFVAVRKIQDFDGREYLDVVIIDTKLSNSTALTPNQTYANNLTSLKVKSIPADSRIKGVHIDEFDVNRNVVKNGPIVKIYSDGNGNYAGTN
ncbi:hypothetical protein GCM10027592_62860 [Spirosoma flavus]